MTIKRTPTRTKRPNRISIQRIKHEMSDVCYLSDDLVITSIDALSDNSVMQRPFTIDGYIAVVMMSGEATLSINLNEYILRPNDIILLSPEYIADLKAYTDQAAAYVLAFSKNFVNEIQIDLATSLPVFMRFGKDPVLHVTPQDVQEIRQVFQLIKMLLHSDKERYRHEMIRLLFTTAFYIITDLNQREQPSTRSKGRGEVIFEEFSNLLQQYNKQERNVGFYANKLGITPKYLSSIIKEVSGKTAARWIDESVILEAKTLLKYSGMSIQEIAYHLNFSTQSFFGKYFKQHTGTSPSRYKRKG